MTAGAAGGYVELRLMQPVVLVTCLVLSLAACAGNTPDPDRSAETIDLCEVEVAKRLGADRDTMEYDSAAKRLGSGGWDVEGTVARPAASTVPFACGVYADGSRDDGPLRTGSVRVPAIP